MQQKIFWRCNVCNDIHYGASRPVVCPSCTSLNAYVEIDPQEAKIMMRLN